MIQIENFNIQSNSITGKLALEKDKKFIPVTFYTEDNNPTIEDFKLLIDKSKDVVELLATNHIIFLLPLMAQELTDSAYSQEKYRPQKEDYTELENDLKVLQINVYPESILLMLKAEKTYPDMGIYCQLDYSLEIEDLIIENT